MEATIGKVGASGHVTETKEFKGFEALERDDESETLTLVYPFGMRLTVEGNGYGVRVMYAEGDA